VDEYAQYDLGVGGGVECIAEHLVLLPQRGGVHDVAVVAQGYLALLFRVAYYGLQVQRAGAPGGGVAHVAYA
jgi:hypothetical protein